MKIQVLTATAVLALFTVTSAIASEEIEATNDAKNSVAIGGDSYGGVDSGGFPHGDSFRAQNEAIAGSIIIDNCDCFDDMYLTNKSRNALAVGNAGAGSIIVE